MRLFVDLSGILHATARTIHLTDSNGNNVGAVFGVLKSLEHLAMKLDPDEIVICLDRGHNARTRRYPDYKKNRKSDPDFRVDLRRQEALLCNQIFPHLPFVVVGENGVEADDIIAELVRFTKLETTGVVTADQDMYQLSSDNCTIYDRQGELAALKFKPEQYVPYKVLVGDVSDNIKGVMQVGPKTATDLIYRYGSLKRILAAAKAGELRLGTMTYNGAAEIIERNLDLITLDGRLLSWEQKKSICMSYARDRFQLKFSDHHIKLKFLELGFTQFLTRLGRFRTAFKSLERDRDKGKVKVTRDNNKVKAISKSEVKRIPRMRTVVKLRRLRKVKNFIGPDEPDYPDPPYEPYKGIASKVIYERIKDDVPDVVRYASLSRARRLAKRISQNEELLRESGIPTARALQILLGIPDEYLLRQKTKVLDRLVRIMTKFYEDPHYRVTRKDEAYLERRYREMTLETPD